MAIQLHPVRHVAVTSRLRSRIGHGQPASPGRVLSMGFTIGSMAAVLGFLMTRPSPLTAIALGAVVLGHALLSFAWEESPDPGRDVRERSG
jgi:hypothetical protein